MDDKKILEYRAAAAACIKWAKREPNKTASLRWTKEADEWTRMADNWELNLNAPRSDNVNRGGN